MKKLFLVLLLLIASAPAGAAVEHEIYITRSTQPTLDLSAFSLNDQMSEPFYIGRVSGSSGNHVALTHLKVIDNAGQGAAFDVLLFNAEPTVASSINGQLDISDTEMRDKFLAAVSVAASDYKVLANGSTANVFNQNQAIKLKAKSTGIWGVLQSKGTPTYPAVTDLRLDFTFREY